MKLLLASVSSMIVFVLLFIYSNDLNIQSSIIQIWIVFLIVLAVFGVIESVNEGSI